MTQEGVRPYDGRFPRREFIRRAGAATLGGGLIAFLASCDNPTDTTPPPTENVPFVPDLGDANKILPPSLTATPLPFEGTYKTPTTARIQIVPTPSSSRPDIHSSTEWQLPADFKYVIDPVEEVKVALPRTYVQKVPGYSSEQFYARDIAGTSPASISFYNDTPNLTFLGEIGGYHVSKLYTLADCFDEQENMLQTALSKRDHTAQSLLVNFNYQIDSPHRMYTQVAQKITEILVPAKVSSRPDNFHFFVSTFGFLEKGNQDNKFWTFTSYTSPVQKDIGIAIMEISLRSLTRN